MKQLRKKFYEVRDANFQEAKSLIEEHHYAGGCSNTNVFCHGLYHIDSPRLLGAAIWLPPTKNAALATYNGDWRSVLALSRLVIVPEVPNNGASFLIGRSVALIREDGRWECLVTYADERVGHTGTIYKATNWEYIGKTPKYTNWVDADGNLVSRQATKSRKNEEMRQMGYKKVRSAKHKYRMVL